MAADADQGVRAADPRDRLAQLRSTAAVRSRRYRPTVSPSAPTDEHLDQIVSALPMGVAIVESSRLEVVYANGAAQQLIHPSDLRRGAELPDPWPAFSLRTYARRLFELGVAPDETVRIDDTHTVSVRGVTTRERETATILLEDVSAAERRRQAEREFVANAAHELLTPLTGIIGAAHVLETGAKEVPEDRDRFIAHIARECTRLAEVSRALLVLARAQSGEQAPLLDVEPLCELLEEIVQDTAGEIPISTPIDCATDITVLVDRDLFRQAVVNLVRNAAKHASGSLAISAERIGFDTVAIEFVDRTARIEELELSDLARRFVSGSSEGEGFGLGLSIARQSIEELGGTFKLAAGGGAGFKARIEVLAGTAW